MILKNMKCIPLYRILLLLFLTCLSCSLTQTKEYYDASELCNNIQIGMTRKKAESILGAPSPRLANIGWVYYYPQKEPPFEFVIIKYENNKVINKDFNVILKYEKKNITRALEIFW